MFFSLFFLFFNGRHRSPRGSEANEPIFTKISGLVKRWKGLITPLSFFWFFKGRCHGKQLKSKNWRFSRTNLLCRAAVWKRITMSQFRFQKDQENEFLYMVYNFSDIRSRNLRVYDVNNSTFCNDMAKIGISHKISQNILDLPWPILQVW